MNARQAAVCLRRLYQAHDEKNEEEGVRAASDLYEILGATPAQAYYAGQLTFNAYIVSDLAERYQGRDEKSENLLYESARRNLAEARGKCGLEKNSPTYTVRWWKACRHRDRPAILNNLIEDHTSQFSHLNPEEGKRFAELCAQKMLDAMEKAHYNEKLSPEQKASAEVRMLEEYFKVYFEAMDLRKVAITEGET